MLIRVRLQPRVGFRKISLRDIISNLSNFFCIYLPGVMKTRVNKHFVFSLNFPCLMACLLMSFFLFVLWLGLCVDVAVDRISRISIYAPHHHHHYHHHHHFYLYMAKTSGKNTTSLPPIFFLS